MGDVPWLAGPVGQTDIISDSVFRRIAEQRGLELHVNTPGAGLMASLFELSGNHFRPDGVDPRIRDFYENTSRYRLDAWCQWNLLFFPLGWMLAWLFGRRLQQLNMPLAPLETSQGISSSIIQLKEPASHRVCLTGWVRKYVRTGEIIYAGVYDVCAPPDEPGPCVRVVFPLPNGSATVILRPELQADGSLVLSTHSRHFGGAGFYFVVTNGDGTLHVRYVRAMTETIHVYVDPRGELRADHVFFFWGVRFLQLHYRIAGPTTPP